MPTASQADTTGEEKPTFDVLPLSEEVRSAIAELGYKHPTPVQRAVFESAVRGRDLVVQARTGTGKTAAFGLPIVDRLVKRRVLAVQAVVLCPTRELALQVTRELGALGKNSGLAVLPVYGGAPMMKQIEGLKAGAQILVGTPGRVLDHLRRGTFDPSKVRVFTLDECDEMLSMGFLPQIVDIWNQLPKQLQVLLFSATVPRAVLRVAESRLREPEFVTLSGDQVGALEIEHFVYLSEGDKIQELKRILQAEAPESAIIFCNTRDDTQRVATALQKAGYEADWLNADLSQNEREAVMAATREERLPFLVCTDVAARGIDISHLTHVINFDFPESNEQYVHRTGRTGRAGRMGTAISLVSPASIGNLYYLRLEYKIHPVERRLPSEQELRTRAETDQVRTLVEQFPSARPADLSLLRRLLTHDHGERVLAAMLGQVLEAGAGTAAEGAKPARPNRGDSPRAVKLARKPINGEPLRRESPRRATAVALPPKEGDAEAPSDEVEDIRVARERRGRSEREPRRPREDRATRSRPEARRRSSVRNEAGITYEVRSVESEDFEAPLDVAAESDGITGASWDGPVDEVFVNVGRDDHVKTEDIKKALEGTEVAADDIAYVRIRQRHSFVGVRPGALELAVNGLTGKTIGGRTVAAEQARPRQARK